MKLKKKKMKQRELTVSLDQSRNYASITLPSKNHRYPVVFTLQNLATTFQPETFFLDWNSSYIINLAWKPPHQKGRKICILVITRRAIFSVALLIEGADKEGSLRELETNFSFSSRHGRIQTWQLSTDVEPSTSTGSRNFSSSTRITSFSLKMSSCKC